MIYNLKERTNRSQPIGTFVRPVMSRVNPTYMVYVCKYTMESGHTYECIVSPIKRAVSHIGMGHDTHRTMSHVPHMSASMSTSCHISASRVAYGNGS